MNPNSPPQEQAFQYVNNNQNPAFHTSPSNPSSFPHFRTLEMPSSQTIPPTLPAFNPILIPETSVLEVQVIGEIARGNEGFKNGVKELYIGRYASAAIDPYYSIRKRVISPFSPYLEAAGFWPDGQVQDGADEASSAGNRRNSKSRKKNLFSCISWNSFSTSHSPNPAPPLLRTTKNLKFLLMKELCRSDVNHLKRIILPKNEAERHLPSLSEKIGTTILVRDVLHSVTWRMKYRFWYNSRSRIYVLEHTGDFVKKYQLKCGDVVALYEDDNGALYIYGKKKEMRDSNSEQVVITPPSQEEINMVFQNPIENPEINGFNAGEISSAQQGSTDCNSLSNYLNKIEDLLFDDQHGTQISTNNNIIHIGSEPSVYQEGFKNFNAISESMFDDHYGISNNGMINAAETSTQGGLLNLNDGNFTNGLFSVAETSSTQGALLNFNDASSYLNELPEESQVFDEYGLFRVDTRPGN